jgi:hypothetical protein
MGRGNELDVASGVSDMNPGEEPERQQPIRSAGVALVIPAAHGDRRNAIERQ